MMASFTKFDLKRSLFQAFQRKEDWMEKFMNTPDNEFKRLAQRELREKKPMQQETLFERDADLTPRRRKTKINKSLIVSIRKQHSQLDQPDWFGQIEMMNGKEEYEETAMSKMNSYVLEIPKEIYKQVIKEQKKAE